MKFKKYGKRRRILRGKKKKFLKVPKNYMSTGQNKTLRKIEVTTPIFACWSTTGEGYYSWFGSTSALGSSNLLRNVAQELTTSGTIYPGLYNCDEMAALARSYQLICFKGLALKFFRDLNISTAAGTWLTLPALYVAPVVDISVTGSVIGRNTAATMDHALRVQVISNDSIPVGKYYPYPPAMSVSGGYTYGSQTYIPIHALRPGGIGSANWVQEIILGFGDAPINSQTPPDVGVFQRVGTLSVTLYVECILGYASTQIAIV